MPEEEKVYCSMYSRNAELYHHGIKGQKWGVRKDSYYEPVGGPPKRKFLESKKNFKMRETLYNNQQIRKNNEQILNKRYVKTKAEKETEKTKKEIEKIDDEIKSIRLQTLAKIRNESKEILDIENKMDKIENKYEDIFLYGIVPGGKNQKHTYEDDMNMWYKTSDDGRKYKQLESQYNSILKEKERDSLKNNERYNLLIKKKDNLSKQVR